MSSPSCFASPRRCMPAILVLLFSLLLTGGAFLATRISEKHRLASEFKELAARPAAALQENIELHLGEMESIGSFYAASQFVERGEFEAFVVGILSRRQAIEKLQWIPRVAQPDRARFEAQARLQLGEDFTIKEISPAGKTVRARTRPVYYPVWYVEPFDPENSALGLDLGVDALYFETISRARKEARLVVTRPFVPGAAESSNPRIAVMLPIYHRFAVGNGLAAPPDSEPFGFIIGIFRINDLIEAAMARVSGDVVEASLYEQKNGVTNGLFYSFPQHSADQSAGAIAERGGLRSQITHTATLRIADREWAMLCQPTEAFIAARKSWTSWGVLAVGLLFSTLVTAYVLSILGRAAWAEQLVAERTSELSKSNARLQEEIGVRRRAEESLGARNRDLESFVYTASHDLRTPLVAIEGFARLLDEDYAGKLDEDGREYVSRVLDSARNMNALLTDLLELSRITSAKEPEEKVSTASVVASVLQDLDHIIKEAGAEVRVADDLPTVNASPTRLRQVFNNLISNAVKFSREEVAPRIEIAWTKAENGYQFAVKDNGIGIPDDQHKQVFEIFKRLKDKDVPGTGVGLAIVQRIVEDHGGEVGLDSTPGEGSTFWFTLPD